MKKLSNRKTAIQEINNNNTNKKTSRNDENDAKVKNKPGIKPDLQLFECEEDEESGLID